MNGKVLRVNFSAAHRFRSALRGARQLPFAAALLVSLGACGTAGIEKVYVSQDADGARELSSVADRRFYASDRAVYCVARGSSGRADATLEGTLRQIGDYTDLNNPVGTDRIIATLSTPMAVGSEPVIYSMGLFPLDPRGEANDLLPLPVGRFRCEFHINDEIGDGKATEFDVFPAECPATQLFTDRPCFVSGQSCPKFGVPVGQPGADPTLCTCTSGLWACQ